MPGSNSDDPRGDDTRGDDTRGDDTGVAGMRRAYRRAHLSEADLAATWLEQFERWLSEATDSLAFPEPNAMVVATATTDAAPSARTVLLKGYDARGLVFYTNLNSRKGREIAANPQVSCVFPWIALERQVLVSGHAEPVDRDEAARYFHSRPHGSQIAASISEQSAVIADRAALEAMRDGLAAAYPPDRVVPLPDFWGGVRIVPRAVEFWQGREDRLHDRLRYRRAEDTDRDGGRWIIERLAP
ncbi:MAG: pyridoxamine 5'-phosphate oxidase [Mycobacteriales bacterium]